MGWEKVGCIEDLQRLGKLKEVIQNISDDLPNEMIPKSSWAKLYAFIQNYQLTHKIDLSKVVEEEMQEKRNFKEITSVAELKKLGSFKEVKQEMIVCMGEEVQGIKGWEKLYQYLEQKCKVHTTLVDTSIDSINDAVSEVYTSPYFKDEVSEMIFYLLELEGEERLKKLGINRRHYKDKELANKWKNKWMKKIHPDENHHEKAEEATKELNRLYRSMIQFAK